MDGTAMTEKKPKASAVNSRGAVSNPDAWRQTRWWIGTEPDQYWICWADVNADIRESENIMSTYCNDALNVKESIMLIFSFIILCWGYN